MYVPTGCIIYSGGPYAARGRQFDHLWCNVYDTFHYSRLHQLPKKKLGDSCREVLQCKCPTVAKQTALKQLQRNLATALFDVIMGWWVQTCVVLPLPVSPRISTTWFFWMASRISSWLSAIGNWPLSFTICNQQPSCHGQWCYDNCLFTQQHNTLQYNKIICNTCTVRRWVKSEVQAVTSLEGKTTRWV